LISFSLHRLVFFYKLLLTPRCLVAGSILVADWPVSCNCVP
jgi:hypothetical protein